MPRYAWRDEALQVESDERDPVQGGGSMPEHSALVTAGIQAWSEGRASAHMLQHWCLQSLVDPHGHPEVLAVAGLGSFGSQPGNTTRDLLRLVEHDQVISLPMATKVGCPLFDPKNGKTILGTMEVFDPGALLKGLAAYDSFDEILRTDLVREFWSNIKPNDPRLVYLLAENPGETQESLSNMVPMFLHGDKVEFANDDSLMVWHMGSVLSKMSSLSSGLLLAATPAKTEVKARGEEEGTWNPVWESIWVPAFTALLQGQTMDGEQIHAAGWRFCIWLLCGDHEHFAVTLRLPHWSNRKFCWECNADSADMDGYGGRRFP